MADFQGFRHLFASIPGGEDGPGFQSAAAAGGLDREVLAVLEQRVGRFPLRGAREGDRSRQVLRYDPEGQFSLLTTFTGLGTGPDGRPGNYLAESLLVPNPWLAGFQWDLGAAFAALEWWGPDGLERHAEPRLDLPDEALPDPRPGALSRLAALREPAVGDQLDRLLIGMVRAATGRDRLLVVEAGPKHPNVLDELVVLLPLAVPPVCRRQPASRGEVALTLRTRGPVEGMPEVQVAGVSDADRDLAEGPGRLVVDLAGRLPMDDLVDTEAFEYVQWLEDVIQRGRWDDLERLYAAAEKEPEGQFFRRFPALRSRLAAQPAGTAPSGPARKRATPAATPPPGVAPPTGVRPEAVPPPARSAPRASAAAANPVAARRQAWGDRHALESAAAAGHDALSTEVREVLALLAAENERAVQQILADWRPKLTTAFAEERKRLKKEIEDELTSEAVAAQKRLQQDARKVLANVRQQGDAMLATWGQQLAERERELARGGAGQAPRRGFAWPGGSGRPPRWLLVAGAVVLAAILATVAWLLWPPGADEGADPAGRLGGPRTERPGDEALLARLQEGDTAAAVLQRAAREAQHASSAAAAGAALLLDEADVGADLRCVLLQAALRRQAPEIGSPLSVDGQCGDGTSTALATAVDGTCCAVLAADRRAACFLAGELEFPTTQRCDGQQLWGGARDWGYEEATAFRELVRAARGWATPGARQHLAAADALDVTRSPDALAAIRRQQPSPEETRLLLDLARELAGGSSASLGEVGTLLDELSAEGAPDGPAAGGAGTVGR